MKKRFNKQQLIGIIDDSFSVAEVAKKLLCDRRTIEKNIDFYTIDTSHFTPNGLPPPNRVGEKYGRLTIAKRIGTKNKKAIWRCICQCGNEIDVSTSDLRSDNTNSCGCLRSELAAKQILNNRTFYVGKYDPVIASAIAVWSKTYSDDNITFEQFRAQSQHNCFYCHASCSNTYNVFDSQDNASQFRKDNGDFLYNGLDRIDSSKTHSIENVVACCFPCNTAKSNMTLNEFSSHLHSMYEFRYAVYGSNYSAIKPLDLEKIESVNQFRYDKPKDKIDVVVGAKIGTLLVKEEVAKCGNHRIFLCECECGKQKSVYHQALRDGKTFSCGGSLCKGRLIPRIASAKSVWFNYKQDGISFDEFYHISQMNCVYCGVSPSNFQSSRRSKLPEHGFQYNGLDRIDSSKGHTIDNVVPSCWNCNRMKCARTLLEFDTWLTNINAHFLSKPLTLP